MKPYSQFTEQEKELHNSEVRIRQVRGDIRAAVTNISKRKGISINAFLKSALIDIINAQPEHMKTPMLD